MAALLDMMEIDATPMSKDKPMVFDTRKAGGKLEGWTDTGMRDGHGRRSVDKEVSPLEIMDPEILKLVNSGKLQAEVHDADLRANNRDQVNLSMYTSEAMEKRRRLKESPHVIHGVYRWWLFLGGGEFNLNTGFISKQNYVDMCTLTEQVMDPAGFEEPASAEAAGQEWDTKMGPDCDSMFWEEFFHEIFEMVDLWTDTCSESAYCDFLRTTLRRVEAMRAKLAEKHIKATAGLADSSIKQEMQAWDPYDQKRNAPPRPPPNAASSQGLQRAGSGYEHEAYSALESAAAPSSAAAVSGTGPVLPLPNTNNTTSDKSPSLAAGTLVAPPPLVAPDPPSLSRESSLATSPSRTSPSRRNALPGHHLLSGKQRAAMVHPRLPERHRNASPERADPLGSPTRHAREELRRAARASSPPKPRPKPRPHSSATLTLPLSPSVTSDRKIASARIQAYIQRAASAHNRLGTPPARGSVYHPLSGGPPPPQGSTDAEPAPPGGALAQHALAAHPLVIRPWSSPRNFLGTSPPLDVRAMYERQVLRVGSSRGRASSTTSTLKGCSKPVSHQEVGRRIAAACIRSRAISAARRGTQARSFPTSHRRARPTSPERAPETAERASWNNGGLAQRLNAAEASAGSGAQPAGDDVVDVGAEVEASGGRRLGCWVSGGNALSSTVPPDTHHRAPLPSGGPELGQGPEGHASGTMVTLPRTFALPSTMDPLLRAERGSPTGWEALTEWKDPQTKQTTFAPLMATSSSSRSNSRNLSAQVHAHVAADNRSTSPQRAAGRSVHSSSRRAGRAGYESGLAVSHSMQDREQLADGSVRAPSSSDLSARASVPLPPTATTAETEFSKHVFSMRQQSTRALGKGKNRRDGDADGQRTVQTSERDLKERHTQVKDDMCTWTPRSGSVCSWDPAPPASHQYSIRGKPWNRKGFHAGNGHNRPLSAAVEDALLSSQQHGSIGRMLRTS